MQCLSEATPDTASKIKTKRAQKAFLIIQVHNTRIKHPENGWLDDSDLKRDSQQIFLRFSSMLKNEMEQKIARTWFVSRMTPSNSTCWCVSSPCDWLHNDVSASEALAKKIISVTEAWCEVTLLLMLHGPINVKYSIYMNGPPSWSPGVCVSIAFFQLLHSSGTLKAFSFGCCQEAQPWNSSLSVLVCVSLL